VAQLSRSKPLAKRAHHSAAASERLAVVIEDFCGQSWSANINATTKPPMTDDRYMMNIARSWNRSLTPIFCER